MSLEAQGAERAVISILMKEPDKFFTINDVLSESDFVNSGSALIFSVIKDIILSDSKASIDVALILSEAEKKGIKDFYQLTLGGELVEAISKINTNSSNIGRYVADIKQASIKRALLSKCSDLSEKVESFVGPSHDLRNMVENGILDTLRSMDTGEDDIICLSDGFEETINSYADLGGAIGIDVGLSRWQEDIGYIRNGAITGLFARSKVGKSQFSMHSLAEAGIKDRLPSLYLDTELQPRQQQMRLCGIISGIPYNIIESGKWKTERELVRRVTDAFRIVDNSPIYYKNIAGRSVNSVIPIIRKFVYRILGGPVVGDSPKGLVIYDYIKLMDTMDLGRNMQEYQLIGLLMSKLHDCAAHLNIPILALGQLNKQEDIGIDRIIHNVDSASILRPKRPEEIQEDGPARGNHVLEVKYCRNGPGHDFNEWINLHFDKSCGQFREDKRNSEVVTVVKKIKEQLESEDMQKLSKVREE